MKKEREIMNEHELKVLWSALYRINADNMASCPCAGCKPALEEGRKVFNDLFRLVQRHQNEHNQTRERAYALWEAAGRPDGDGVEFWLRAEAELTPAPPVVPERRISPAPFHERQAATSQPVRQVAPAPKSNKSMMAEMQAAAEYRANR